MEGDIPSPQEGATLTIVSTNIAVLIGGQEHTNMDCSEREVFLKDLNAYEESSCKGIYVIKINLKNTKHYTFEKKGELPVAIAYHSTVYSKHTNTLVVLGGLNVTNSSKNPGERQSLNPILIDTVTLQVLSKKIVKIIEK